MRANCRKLGVAISKFLAAFFNVVSKEEIMAIVNADNNITEDGDDENMMPGEDNADQDASPSDSESSSESSDSSSSDSSSDSSSSMGGRPSFPGFNPAMRPPFGMMNPLMKLKFAMKMVKMDLFKYASGFCELTGYSFDIMGDDMHDDTPPSPVPDMDPGMDVENDDGGNMDGGNMDGGNMDGGNMDGENMGDNGMGIMPMAFRKGMMMGDEGMLENMQMELKNQLSKTVTIASAIKTGVCNIKAIKCQGQGMPPMDGDDMLPEEPMMPVPPGDMDGLPDADGNIDDPSMDGDMDGLPDADGDMVGDGDDNVVVAPIPGDDMMEDGVESRRATMVRMVMPIEDGGMTSNGNPLQFVRECNRRMCGAFKKNFFKLLGLKGKLMYMMFGQAGQQGGSMSMEDIFELMDKLKGPMGSGMMNGMQNMPNMPNMGP